MKVVFASHSAFDPVLRVGSHHLSREFARLGDSVAHVSTPVSLAHIARIQRAPVRRRFRQSLRPRKDSDGVVRIVPFTALPLSARGPMSPRLKQSVTSRGWKKLCARPDVLFVDQPLFAGAIDALRPKLLIYRPTDAHYDHVSRAAELNILSRCDAVVATSPHVLSQVMEGVERTVPTLVLENGVEYERFLGSETEFRDGACYVGAIDHRFDWATVLEIAEAIAPSPVSIIGPLTSPAPSSTPPNLHLLPPLPYDEVPAVLRRHKVGLLPFNASPVNEGRSPMKYYEYLAAGLNILATPTSALRTRRAPGVWFTSSTNDSVPATLAAISAPANVAGAEFAAAFSWTSRAKTLRDFVESIR